MKRMLSVVALAALASVLWAEEKPSEESRLAALKKLAAPLSRDKADLDAEEVKELHEKQGKEALKIAKEFESEHPKSKSLNDARLYALKALSMAEGMATDEEAIALAKRLRKATEKGTDHAAQA